MDRPVRRTKILKTIRVSDNLFISIRRDEITVYKILRKPKKPTVVYTLDADEWQKVMPYLNHILKKFY